MTNAEYKAKVNWLSRAFNLDKKINNLTRKIDFLRSTAAGTCIKVNPEILGGGFDGSKMETKVITYVDLEKQREGFQKELETTRGEISQAIYGVEDPASFSVLVSRYLDYKSWDDIAELLSVSYEGGYAFQLHRRAVRCVQVPKDSA